MKAIAPKSGGDLQVEIISDPATFTRLREEWNDLLQDSESDGFFLTWEWLNTWWKHLADQRELVLISVRSGPRLIALAPLAIRPGSLFRAPPLRCIEMLGSGTAGSDHLDVIARRGWEDEAAQAIAGVLTSTGRMMVLARLRGVRAFAQALFARLEKLGWRARQQAKSEVCPFVPRPAGGFTDYLASLGSEHRYAFRRKVQALRKKHRVSFEPARTDDERRAALKILIDLHRKRWSGREVPSDAFDGDAMCAFHEEISAIALEKGWLRLFVLRVDDQPVAALYGFRYGKIFSFYQSGFDPAWGKQSVGLVTMGLAIESAFDEGVDEFDMLHGDEAYKFHWAHKVHDLSRAELYPPGARGVLCEGITELAKSARGIGRRLLRPNTGVARAAST